jgi:hypothetical protein
MLATVLGAAILARTAALLAFFGRLLLAAALGTTACSFFNQCFDNLGG